PYARPSSANPHEMCSEYSSGQSGRNGNRGLMVACDAARECLRIAVLDAEKGFLQGKGVPIEGDATRHRCSHGVDGLKWREKIRAIASEGSDVRRRIAARRAAEINDAR